MEDVEARWQKDDPAERARVTQLLYQHRRQSIDQLVGDFLIEEAAKKAGVAKEKYLEDRADEAPRRDHRGRHPEGLRREPRARRRLDGGRPARVDHRRSSPATATRRTWPLLVDELKAAGPPVTRRARSAALRGGDRRPRSVARAGRRADHDRRVLRVPVPVLRPRHAHAQAARAEVRGQGPARLQGLPAAQPRRRRPRPPKPRTAPATRASTGSCTTGCSPTSSSCRCPS